MDLQVRGGSASSSNTPQPTVASVCLPVKRWSFTSFQRPSSHEVQSISRLVPSTVLTLMPHYKPKASGHFCSERTPELQLPGSSSSPSGPTEAPDQKPMTSASPCSDNLKEVQQRNLPDGGQVEEGSIGLVFPKDLTDEESGMDS